MRPSKKGPLGTRTHERVVAKKLQRPFFAIACGILNRELQAQRARRRLQVRRGVPENAEQDSNSFIGYPNYAISQAD